MSKIVGIDLGTTNSLVATVDSGIPLIIPDAEGNRLTPSVVHFSSGVDEPVVGHGANRVRALSPSESLLDQGSWTAQGRNLEEEMLVTHPVSGNSTGDVTIDIHGRLYPEEISPRF
jgi:molecular chaperone DnaK